MGGNGDSVTNHNELYLIKLVLLETALPVIGEDHFGWKVHKASATFAYIGVVTCSYFFDDNMQICSEQIVDNWSSKILLFCSDYHWRYMFCF